MTARTRSLSMARPAAREAKPAQRQRGQRGVSLILSLVLLVIVTLLALGSLRGTTLQTRMSGTAGDRAITFEAAEAALRQAEREAALATTASFPGAGCSGGFCITPAAGTTPRWQDAAFTAWKTSTAQVPTNAPTPQAIVEDMGDAPNWPGCENEIPRQANCMTRRYRITARSQADSRAAVTVQSQYAAP